MSTEQEEALDRADQQFKAWLVGALTANIPESELPADLRLPCAEEFLGFLGQLQALFAGQQPSPAKAAAMFFLMESFQLDKATEAPSRQIVTLVEATKKLQAELRRSRQAQQGAPS